MTEIASAHREALIEATVAELTEVGYGAASLNRIIRAAGISKSSFYHAVASKAELFDAVVRMLVDDVRAHWNPPLPDDFRGPGFWEQVDRTVADMNAVAAGNRAIGLLGRIFYLPDSSLPGSTPHGETGVVDARAELLRAVREWVAAVLRAGRESGQVRDDLPLDLQADVTFAVLRAIDEWVLDGTAAERASVAAHAPVALLRRMLAA